MRVLAPIVLVVAEGLVGSVASAQPPSTVDGDAAPLPPAPPPPPAVPAVIPPPLPPQATAASTSSAGEPGLAEASNLTGAPNPNGIGASSSDEWRFSSHGYMRAPMRIGVGKRPECPAGQSNGAPTPGANGSSVPCAGPGESTTNLHSPMLPDDQYLDWRYTRQWEKDWGELFLNYGNSRVVGTLSLQGYHFTDAAFNDTSAQFGIAQGYVTIRPDLSPRVRVEWRVGAFWDKYGMAGIYDAGKYDTYLFGRTHLMGETLTAEIDVGDFTIRGAHGLGTKSEQWGFQFPPVAPNGSPAVALPGFTLANHMHLGASYKKRVEANIHYLVSWAQDARAIVVTSDVSNHDRPGPPDGSISIAGAELRLTGGIFGTLYAAYSHIGANHAEVVGPAIEVIHSLGGGGMRAANGLLDNYLGACTRCSVSDTGVGSIDSVSIQYDYSFGLLYRTLKDPKTPGFWGEGSDVNLSLFGMYTSVSSKDVAADGTSKLKYGADLVYAALPWLGAGLRADVVQPSSKDANMTFWVVSPKVMLHTRWVTHEEITLQYSHYNFSSAVTPQFPNGPPLIGTSPITYPPDENVFGLKCSMWW
jgi:hypothetical protein